MNPSQHYKTTFTFDFPRAKDKFNHSLTTKKTLIHIIPFLLSQTLPAATARFQSYVEIYQRSIDTSKETDRLITK